MNQDIKLLPQRPYFARAIYEWLCDNELTPYILVDAQQKNTRVPQQFVKDGQITLNIAPQSVHQFHMDNDAMSFSARFSGVPHQLYIPMSALLGIYARENGNGLFFDPSEYDDVPVTPHFQDADDEDDVSSEIDEKHIDKDENPQATTSNEKKKATFSFVD